MLKDPRSLRLSGVFFRGHKRHRKASVFDSFSSLAQVDKLGMKNNNVSGGLVALGCLAMLVLVPVIMVLSVLISGYTIQHLWGWFAVPLGLPVIGYMHAAGIGALVNYMCPFVDTSNLARKEGTSSTEVAIGQIILYLIARPGLTLLFGYIVHSYMV